MIYVFLGVACSVTANLCLGYALNSISVIQLLIPWCMTAVVIAGVALLNKGKQAQRFELERTHISQLIIYMLASVVAAILWCVSVTKVGVGPVAIISHSRVLLYLLIGVLFFSEKVTKPELIASFIIVIGVITFAYGKPISYNLGIVYSLIATLCYTVQRVLNKTLTKRVSYELVVGIRAILLGITVLVLGLLLDQPILFTPSPNLVAAIVIGGATGVYFAKVYDFKALETVPFFKFGLIQSIRPVLIFILAAALLAEGINAQKIIATILVIGGVLGLQLFGSHSNQTAEATVSP